MVQGTFLERLCGRLLTSLVKESHVEVWVEHE